MVSSDQRKRSRLHKSLRLSVGATQQGGPTGRHWVLDPVDGTLGFVRGDQYAVALALIEDGKLVLGCPNYPMKKDFLNYNHQRNQTMPKAPPSSDNFAKRMCDVCKERKWSGMDATIDQRGCKI
ncbi:hypothetical protein F3Y22_tig00111392pilonHSYRG00363 [Hibiscus syriacus]|uniref:PAP-specific phosphatase HAL2-like n=1 Tax=Hibiscus syriacus TaxID=106335 RepID=A0A6A2XWL4_HIBSY|nr:hypothetical protein F3Y22_tig00111392pilonHSYRG00363 [Hibiscus syriacus]